MEIRSQSTQWRSKLAYKTLWESLSNYMAFVFFGAVS